MNEFFKEMWNKKECKRNGACSQNPVLNALEVVILNEIKQIAFYTVKLKELNYTNDKIAKKAVFALSVVIADTDFGEKEVLDFYKKINDLKNEVKNFYLEKTSKMNISYEIIPSVKENFSNVTELIKTGEDIIKQYRSAVKSEKLDLAALISSICKTSSTVLSELANYKEVNPKYYFEILRLLNLLNNIGTREEKFIRRIKEFSDIDFKMREELNFEEEKLFGCPKDGILDISLYEGKSILVYGFDLFELYNLLEKTKDEKINIYAASYLVRACVFPKFREYENFRGILGTGDIEYDFSNFKGAIYVTEHSSVALESAFRGTIFTTKQIASNRVRKISKEDLSPLIEETKKLEGYEYSKVYENLSFEYAIEENDFKDEEKILVILGNKPDSVEEKFKGYKIFQFIFPDETIMLYKIINLAKNRNVTVYFSDCSINTVGIITSLLNKNLSDIYLSSCSSADINPHIAEALKKYFQIKNL